MGLSGADDEVGRGGSGLDLWDPNFFLSALLLIFLF